MTRTHPSHGSPSFACPHCQTQAQQDWSESVWVKLAKHSGSTRWRTIDRSECHVCEKEAIWFRTELSAPTVAGGLSPGAQTPDELWTMIWPPTAAGEPPHKQLPESLRDLYEEARAVAVFSPRAAAALLRLLTEDLVRQFADPNATLNDNIGALVRDGKLGSHDQQMADYLRITGNRAVHPGQVDDVDGEASRRADLMFTFINLLVERFIALPERIAEAYAQLPEGARAAVERRDSTGA
ncbi:DUF4145 domain-containing protein [Brachybacterium epidermidis]|uniref:DUF4145 domain-containing protein n=1 Tax=Brachybacterium epidermidis TaxID=2781983 RepID=UPI00398EE0D6